MFNVVFILVSVVAYVLLPTQALADPATILSLAAVLAPLFGETLAPFVATFLIYGGLSAGLSAVQYAFTDSPSSSPLSSEINRLRNIQRGTAEPSRIIYGEAKLSGVLNFAESVNLEGEREKGAQYLHFDLVIGEGPISEIFAIELNDELANQDKFSERTGFAKFLGAADQEMFRGPISLLGGNTTVYNDHSIVGTTRLATLPDSWLAENRPLKNNAHLYCVLKHDQEIFPGGAPSVRMRVRGRLLYDLRQDVSRGGSQIKTDQSTWTYSNNSALCVYDFLTNRDFGMGVPASRMDDDTWIAAADACDQMVPRFSTASDPATQQVVDEGYTNPAPDRDGPATHKRYQTDGVIFTDESPINILEKLVSAMAGACFYYQGKWYAYAGVAQPVDTWPDDPALPAALRGAEITITEDDIRNDTPVEFAPSPGRKNRVNTVSAQFINPDNDFQADISPGVTGNAFLVEDNGQKFSVELQLPLTANVDRAQRIQRIRLLESRFGSRVTVSCFPRLNYISPWSVVRLELPYLGITAPNNKYRVVSVTLDPATGAPTFDLAQYDDSIYSGTLEKFVQPPATQLPDPFFMPPPAAVSVVEQLVSLPNGERAASLSVSITPTTKRTTASGYRIYWKNVDSSEEFETATVYLPTTTHTIHNLPRGTYRVEVRAFSGKLLSTPVTVDARITYRTAAPNLDVVRFLVAQATDQAGRRKVTWEVFGPPADLDHFQILMRHNDDGVLGADVSNEVSTATLIATVPVSEGTAANTEGAFPSTQRDGLWQYSAVLDQPTIPGEYALYLRGVDKTLQVDPTPSFLSLSVLEDTLLSGISRSFSGEGWVTEKLASLGASVLEGSVTSAGLVGRAALTWQDVQDDNPTTTWDENVTSKIIYVSPIVSSENESTIVFSYDIRAAEGTRYGVQMRSRRQGGAWSSWGTQRGRIGLDYQFRLTAFSSSGSARIQSFTVTATEKLDTEIVEDFDVALRTSSQNGAFTTAAFAESSRADWWAGQQSGLTVESGSIQLDLNPFLVCATNTSGQATHAAQQNLTSQFSLGATVMFDSDASALGTVNIVKKGVNYGINFVGGVGFKLTTTGAVFVPGEDPNDMPAISINDDDPEGGRPYRVMYTHDGNFLRGYLDGELKVTYASAAIFPSDTFSPVTIAGDGFEGPVGDVSAWSRALSDEEVSLYQHLSDYNDQTSLLYRYRLDEGLGTTMKDSSSYANHGTITNGSWASVGWRRSPDIEMDIFQLLDGYAVAWSGYQPGGTTVTVQARRVHDASGDTSWSDVSQISGFSAVENTLAAVQETGKRLQCRQVLRATNYVAQPFVSSVAYLVNYRNSNGYATVTTTKNFQRLDSAKVVAVQGSTAGAAWSLVKKTRQGALFSFTTSGGEPANPTVDVQFEGAAVGR